MQDSITVYSLPSCPKCQLLKMELRRRNINFTECQDEDIMLELGYTQPPTMVIQNDNSIRVVSGKAALEYVKENF